MFPSHSISEIINLCTDNIYNFNSKNVNCGYFLSGESEIPTPKHFAVLISNHYSEMLLIMRMRNHN